MERFWSKVDASGDCWEWTGCVLQNGYGQFSDEGRRVFAHRFVWELLVGPIPEGLTIDHLCRNKICVNPDHLEPTSMRVNVLRGEGPTARNARKTICKRGHALRGSNLYVPASGTRQCRACRRIRKVSR